MDFQTNNTAKCWPRFYTTAEEIPFKSAQAGKPVYEDVEMVEIIIPGDQRTNPHFRVKFEHRERWPTQYEAFKSGKDGPADGTPLTEWPPATPAWIENLRVHKIRTVEELANLSDSLLQNIGMGAGALRDRAKAWLKAAEGNAPLADLLARAERAEERAAHWEGQYKALDARVAAIEIAKTQEKAA